MDQLLPGEGEANIARRLMGATSGIYLNDQMVEDPIAHVSFPKIAAATSLEWQGKKFYFIGEETRREFEKQQRIGSK